MATSVNRENLVLSTGSTQATSQEAVNEKPLVALGILLNAFIDKLRKEGMEDAAHQLELTDDLNSLVKELNEKIKESDSKLKGWSNVMKYLSPITQSLSGATAAGVIFKSGLGGLGAMVGPLGIVTAAFSIASAVQEGVIAGETRKVDVANANRDNVMTALNNITSSVSDQTNSTNNIQKSGVEAQDNMLNTVQKRRR